MNILSLFDGVSCGYEALQRAGTPIDNYFASEVDGFAIKTAIWNHPDIIQLGDVRNISYRHGVLYSECKVSCKDGIINSQRGETPITIDLVMGGSPCQGFSNAGKHLNFSDPRSKLFFEYMRILKEVQPKYFLLENVAMKKEWEETISSYMGVEPYVLDSTLTSAAARKRLYWTNIKGVQEPEDRGITFGDIREHNVQEKSMYYSEKLLAWIDRHEKRVGKKLKILQDSDKIHTLTATMNKGVSNYRFFGIEDTYGLRYITPLECERCMNLPDGYTSQCSKTQRYKQLGNG